jgi:hypothetical protein
MARRGLPFTVDQHRYWAIMLPLFVGSTRLKARLAQWRRALVTAFHLVDRASLDELGSRVERIEGLLARVVETRARSRR